MTAKAQKLVQFVLKAPARLSWQWAVNLVSHVTINLLSDWSIFFFLTGFYVDCQPPDFCFVPCGHMASEKTVKYWASVPIPCGTSGFQSACPFCAVPLTGETGYTKLIFQDMCD